MQEESQLPIAGVLTNYCERFEIETQSINNGLSVRCILATPASVITITGARPTPNTATLYGSITAANAISVAFEYRAVGSTEWQSVTATQEHGIFTANVMHLQEGTIYEFRCVASLSGETNQVVGEIKTF